MEEDDLIPLHPSQGLVETVCITLLSGLSMDFLLHVAHAYLAPTALGLQQRSTKPRTRGSDVETVETVLLQEHEIRTVNALLSRGPTVLRAGGTTIISSCIMYTCQIQHWYVYTESLL